MAPQKSDLKLLKTVVEFCRDYIHRAHDSFAAEPFVAPDITDLADVQLELRGIRRARTDGADRFNLGWSFVAIQVRNLEHERYVDQFSYPWMVLFAVAGCDIGLGSSKVIPGEPERGYLSYGGKSHQLRRLIVGATPGHDVRQRHPTAFTSKNGRSEAHYDYRRVTLQCSPKAKVMASGQLTRRKGKTRVDAIAFATLMFEQRFGKTTPYITVQQFRALLEEAFAVGDDLYLALKAVPQKPN